MTKLRAAWWWIDRWRSSEAYMDLSAGATGLYRNICDEVWLRDGGVIPEESLAKVSGFPEEWPKYREEILAHLARVPGGWTSTTALEVMERSLALAEKRSKAGSKGGSKTQANRRAKRAANVKSPSPSPSPSPDQGEKGGREEGGVGGEAPGGTAPPARVSQEAERLIREAILVANEANQPLERVLELASYIPTGNGREERCFSDPRRPGIGKEWIETTLRQLPAVRRRLLRQPRL